MSELAPDGYEPQAFYLLEVLTLILAIVIPLLLCVLYVTYAERKIIGYIQCRVGPNRVGFFGRRFWGLGQPVADAVKLIFKEIIIPKGANKRLFVIAPMLSVAPSLAAWAVIPFDDGMALADINAGLPLHTGPHFLGGLWDHHRRLGLQLQIRLFGRHALRGADRVLRDRHGLRHSVRPGAAGSLNLGRIVTAQAGSLLHWFWLPLLPIFLIYFISGVAETNRAPFDVTEGESELVAGFHVEYSGMAFSIFFMAEYANMILISVLTALLFCGGWLSPFQGLPLLDGLRFLGEPNIVWLLLKTSLFLFLFLWFRATFPRYRYDQIMRLGWKVFLPITIVWIVVVAGLVAGRVPPWFD